ncbi:MAG TPA: BMP family ABC transporter substrate-binding protein [Spirochaetales bacterium]|nr:BMP family ABC transporter substrate-binding protein [Spirochaetales bacterium]HRY54976.1 BMP family ABC transporter substrate-binding protein [Spirochaetia bacterium]HRZ64382.1 BMP family ABC transporter substrate-binding protein [Spirochaetia bacterium]
MRRPAALAILLLALAAAGCRRAEAPPAPAPRSRPIGLAFAEGTGAAERLRSLAASLEGCVAGDPEGNFGARVELRGLASRLGGQDREQLLRVLAEGGCGLVVACGPDYAPAARLAASAFPSVSFALVGASEQELFPAGVPARPNLSGISFADEEASFLAGVLAGLVAGERPGAKVGFLGGMDCPAVRACDSGFCAGAAYANPALRRPGMILRQYCGKGAEAFSDPEAAAAIASVQFRSGAEAVYHAAGASGRGLYEAARRAGRLALGSDAGPGSPPATPADPVIGRASRDEGRALLLLAREYLGSGAPAGGHRRLGLASGLVAFEAGSYADARIAPRLPAVDEARSRLASGSIAVPREELALAEYLRSLR